jgi:competence protein ComEC
MKSILTAVIILALMTAVSSAVVRVHFINVGHGDAILIEEDGEGLALVDAGKPEVGHVVLDYIRSQGIEGIDHLFVTHDHRDHLGGVPMILDSLDVGTVYHTGMVHDWPEAQLLNQYLQTGNWLIEVVGAGDVPVKRGQLAIEVLSPVKEVVAGKTVDANPNSMALLVTHGSVKVLLTADIFTGREAWLIEHCGESLQCQAMKASHHASALGNSAEFLRAVNPEVIVVTVGENEWGYPNKETMIRLSQHCPLVLRTDEVGTVVLESDGNELEVVRPEGIEP